MKHQSIYASVFAFVVMAVAFAFGLGHDAQPFLSLCVDWIEGCTAHTDGLALATAAAVAPAVVKEQADKLIENLKGITGKDGDPKEQIEALQAELKTLKDEKSAKADADAAAKTTDAITRLEAEIKAMKEDMKVGAPTAVNAPAIITTGLGDNYAKALAQWVRTGDVGGVKHLVSENDGGQQMLTIGADPGTNEMSPEFKAWKASNNTDMNIGTAADGGNAVPTGHLNEIIARRDETMLAGQIGARLIPGVGTTVNVPIDDEADGEFVTKAETNDSDRDAPAIGQKAFTLAVYTKYLDLSYELLRDETSGVLSFISDFVGRGMAKTHNDLLVNEVEANGTVFNTFAADDAIAAGELEAIEGNDDLGPYLEDSSVGWIMRNSTLAAIKSITGNDRLYASQATGAPNTRGRELLEYPVWRTNKVEAIGAGNKPVLFGNWFYMGYRAPDGLQFLRDPYSVAIKRQVRLHYYFSAVYGILQAEAVGYGRNTAT